MLGERKGTMHCDAFPSSLRTSLQPSALGLGARFAVTRGQPLDPAEGLCPSDSLRWLGNSTCGNVFEWVRYSMREHPYSMSQGVERTLLK